MKIRSAALRRLFFALAYCVFLLVLLEVALQVGGRVMLGASRAADHANSDVVRILAIGESTTYGLGVDPGEAYPAQLERMLNEGSGPKVVVINTGVPGQTTTSVLRNIDYQLRKYRPHIVISMLGVNDTNEALNDVSSRLWFGFYVPEILVHVRVFRLATIVRDYVFTGAILSKDGAWQFFDPAQRAADGGWVRNLYYQKQLELNYKDVIDKIESYGAHLLMTSYLRAERDVGRLLARIAREKAVTYLDLYSPSTDSPEYFTADRFHPSALGHRVIATKLRDVLRQKGWLDQSLAGAGQERAHAPVPQQQHRAGRQRLSSAR